MTRAMLQAYNRAQTNIILGSTSLKIKVELRVDGISMECGEFESIPQMKSWVRAKVKQWREMSAGRHRIGIRCSLTPTPTPTPSSTPTA